MLPEIPVETPHQVILETVSQTLETMAFICVEPITEAAVPDEPLCLSMKFDGPSRGAVEMVASRNLGRRLASEVLMVEADDPEFESRAEDALREILNVVVGAMMPHLARSPGDVFNLGLPETADFDPNRWSLFTDPHKACLLDAETQPIGFRIAA